VLRTWQRILDETDVRVILDLDTWHTGVVYIRNLLLFLGMRSGSREAIIRIRDNFSTSTLRQRRVGRHAYSTSWKSAASVTFLPRSA
jgi:membrane protease subunit (stomatin/prohibitin family)